jgi:rhodanese-related sulfurtransferase
MSKKITASEFKNLLAGGSDMEVVDVREPVEFQSEKLKGSKNIPLSVLGKKALNVPKHQTAYLVCRSGNRASQAAEKLESLGYENVLVIEGGLEECKRRGIAVETENTKVWALDRQVRFAAGALVLFGIFLSWILHPAFIGLSLFVGAGLVFSGVTDTCGMGMLLAKMPWNQVNAGSCSIPK